MKDRVSHSNHEFTNTKEVEDRIDVSMFREDTKAVLGQIMSTEDAQDIIKVIEAEQDTILIIEVVMGTILQAIKGMGDIIIMMIITEGVVIEIKVMIGIGVGHMKERKGT